MSREDDNLEEFVGRIWSGVVHTLLPRGSRVGRSSAPTVCLCVYICIIYKLEIFAYQKLKEML
jgi:hypothetical protein